MVVSLDDTVVYSKTLVDDHKKRLHLVFEKLNEDHLYVKREKCLFAQDRINFLGHVTKWGRICTEEEGRRL